MNNFVLNIIDSFGYFGMFLGMVLEAVIIIIPSELILATGGILAGRGVFSFLGAFLTGLIGSLFCAIIIYVMGYFGGNSFIKKYGKYFFMNEKDLDKANIWFEKYGFIACLIGRNVPIVRTLISLPIGISRLSFKKFLIYTLVGCIPWTFVFVYFGYSLGNNWTVLSDITSRMKIPIRLLIITLLLLWIISNVIKKKKSSSQYRTSFVKNNQ